MALDAPVPKTRQQKHLKQMRQHEKILKFRAEVTINSGKVESRSFWLISQSQRQLVVENALD